MTLPAASNPARRAPAGLIALVRGAVAGAVGAAVAAILADVAAFWLGQLPVALPQPTASLSLLAVCAWPCVYLVAQTLDHHRPVVLAGLATLLTVAVLGPFAAHLLSTQPTLTVAGAGLVAGLVAEPLTRPLPPRAPRWPR